MRWYIVTEALPTLLYCIYFHTSMRKGSEMQIMARAQQQNRLTSLVSHKCLSQNRTGNKNFLLVFTLVVLLEKDRESEFR